MKHQTIVRKTSNMIRSSSLDQSIRQAFINGSNFW